MTPQNADETEVVLNSIKSDNEAKVGILCLNCLIVRSRFKEIYDFMNQHNIPFPERQKSTKLELLDQISIHLYNQYQKSSTLKKKFDTPLHYIGNFIVNDEILSDYLTRFDFISKQDLIDEFADYCADYGISVYRTIEIKEFSLDLYLIKKKPFLRTEAVFVRTGKEMNEENYKDTFYQISEASKVAIWTVFVTTPRGVCNIGLERLKTDMEKLNAWLYVIDPISQKILGILKGKKSKNYDTSVRDEYIAKLPREAIRTPSQIAKISKFYFKEAESYNPNDFVMFGLLPNEKLLLAEHSLTIKPKFKETFRTLMIIDKDSGLNIISHSSEELSMDKELISGFMSAMDSFISEIGGSSSMNEINYKGFYVHAVYGKKIKCALFLSKPAHQSLKDRLAYFLNHFEEHYPDQILEFDRSGNSAVFDKPRIVELIKEILSI